MNEKLANFFAMLGWGKEKIDQEVAKNEVKIEHLDAASQKITEMEASYGALKSEFDAYKTTQSKLLEDTNKALQTANGTVSTLTAEKASLASELSKYTQNGGKGATNTDQTLETVEKEIHPSQMDEEKELRAKFNL
jgi:predicted  nucleic acid-binding Zn-ribbon protein